MERNADETFAATGSTGSPSTGAGATSGMTTGLPGNSAPAGGLDYTAESSSTTDTVRDKAADVRDAAQDKLGQAKEKARQLQSSLADRLDAGAEKLRQRSRSGTLAGATATGTADVGTETNERMTQVQDSVARGMEKSADWLRNGDLRADVERQVRENPGRTLLIALGVGYLLGKAFRNNR